jgi:hypothetical protein
VSFVIYQRSHFQDLSYVVSFIVLTHIIELILIQFCRLSMNSNSEIRSDLATAQSISDFKSVINKLKKKYLQYHLGECIYPEECDESDVKTSPIYDLKYPPWICQPYVRPTPTDHLRKMEEKQLEVKVYYILIIF